MGPDQTKTWRSLLNIHPPGTNLSLPTYPPEPDIPAPTGAGINQSDSGLPDEQILPRQTRSGRLYFAGIQNTQELISVNKLQQCSSSDKDYHTNLIHFQTHFSLEHGP